MSTVSANPPLHAQSTLARAPKYVKSIDGLRALAVLAVMGHHFGFPPNATGWLGVDVFFALSGFLITTLLCREYQANHAIALRQFWMRRFCRLMPAYWAYAAFVSILLLATHAKSYVPLAGWTPGWFLASLWFYFINWLPGIMWTHQALTFHLWSLALEEQFYFVWPFFCFIALCLPRGWLVPIAGFVFLIALQFIPGAGMGRSSYVRGMGILAGCGVAMFSFQFARGTVVSTVSEPRIRNGMMLAFAGVVAGFELYAHHLGAENGNLLRTQMQDYVVPPLVVLVALIITGLWYGPADRVSRALSWRPLSYLGTISYGMYLYHMACLLAVKSLVGWMLHRHGIKIRFYFVVPIFITSVIAVASLSYWVLERPFLKLKDRFRPAVLGKTLLPVDF